MVQQNTPVFSGKSVLIADDSDVNRLLAAEVLSSADFDVSTVDDGQQALEFVQRQSVDMVLMDIEMPVMDGLSATRKIRELGGVFRHLPIIAMTAADTEEDKAQGVSAGMNDYLTKPLEPDAMFLVAQKWLGARDKACGEQGRFISEIFETLSRMDNFDFVAALHRIRGNENLLTTMLCAFVNTYGAADQELPLLLDQGKYTEAERLLHQIKGSGANLGLVGLSRIAGNIERQLKQQQYSIADESLADFTDHIYSMCQHLADLEPPVKQQRTALVASVDRGQVVSHLEKIRQSLGNDLGEVKQEIDGLMVLSEGTEYENMASDIEMAFNRFDLSGLNQKIDKFLNQ